MVDMELHLENTINLSSQIVKSSFGDVPRCHHYDGFKNTTTELMFQNMTAYFMDHLTVKKSVVKLWIEYVILFFTKLSHPPL